MFIARNKPTEKEIRKKIDLLIESNCGGISDNAKIALQSEIFKIISQAQEKLDQEVKSLESSSKPKP